jgi:hypothetical protein
LRKVLASTIDSRKSWTAFSMAKFLTVGAWPPPEKVAAKPSTA